MLGDTGVAVNPNDERYKHLIGKTLHPADHEPRDPDRRRRVRRHGVRHRRASRSPRAHDPNDFEVGQRHNLPIDPRDQRRRAPSTQTCGKYAGMDRYECRKAIVEDLEDRRLAGQDRGRTSTTSAPATAAAPPLSRWSPRSGSSRWSRSPSPPSTLSTRARPSSCPSAFDKTYLQLDGEHPRLVHLPSALVGPPHPGVTTATTAAR